MGKLPKRQLPSAVKSKVNVLALKKNILKVKDKMARSEMKRAKKLISDLKDGAEAYQILYLPPISTPNARSAFDHGAVLTDTVCTWVKKGFVAGPFDTPPVPGFRGNQLAVVPRNGKIRPILNLSSLKGGSFNDTVMWIRELSKGCTWERQNSSAFFSGMPDMEPDSRNTTSKMPTS